MEQFHCLRCGNCCRWPGAVRVGEAEIDAIAAYLGIPLEQFLTEYTELLPDRTGLTLPEKPDGRELPRLGRGVRRRQSAGRCREAGDGKRLFSNKTNATWEA